MTKCDYSGKTRFNSEGEAQRALARIRRKPRAKYPFRYYLCDKCNGLHLSASPERPAEERPIILADQFKQYLIVN